MPSQIEIRTTITSQIVEALQSGKLPPWRRPWALDRNAGHPANVVSKRSYRGINPLILGVASARHNLRSKWWATFNQWKELGGSVMRRPDDVPPGKWGTAIIYWQRLTRTIQDEAGEDEEQRFFFCRMYTVFNIDQVSGEACARPVTLDEIPAVMDDLTDINYHSLRNVLEDAFADAAVLESQT